MKRYHLFEFADFAVAAAVFSQPDAAVLKPRSAFGIVFRRCTDARQGAAGDREWNCSILDQAGQGPLPGFSTVLPKITGLWCGRR